MWQSWDSFMSICHKLESFGKRAPQLRKCPDKIGLREKPVLHFLSG